MNACSPLAFSENCAEPTISSRSLIPNALPVRPNLTGGPRKPRSVITPCRITHGWQGHPIPASEPQPTTTPAALIAVAELSKPSGTSQPSPASAPPIYNVASIEPSQLPYS